MDVRFHCSYRVRRSGKKSRHDVFGACADICKVLKLHPDYGAPSPGSPQLRKMRIMVPGLASGKSGGYRLIYRKQVQDETLCIVFLETYFKGDREDLTRQEYKTLTEESEVILRSPLSYGWENG